MIEQPALREVFDTTAEGPGLKTLAIRHSTPYEPGQFFLLWLPGVDEKPFSLSGHRDEEVRITVKERGPFTRTLLALAPGAMVGIRGPYGKGFTLTQPGARVCVVAGGIGIAPLAPLIEKLTDPLIIHGASRRNELLFRDRFPRAHLATDDGSQGFHGTAVQAFRSLAETESASIDVVYTCGPEQMMREVFDLCEARGIECQAALERYIKCGIGVCGQCCCDGQLVCRDGPVFPSSLLRRLSDFGRLARLKDGRVTTIEDYTFWREGTRPLRDRSSR
jgi:dihydroorotate dehydrogenase electron transfer subunit